MLNVTLGPLKLKNPILSASGCFGQEDEAASFIDLNRLGGLVLKTVTLKPRAGNPPPRIVEVSSGILNSIGLPNKGIDRFLAESLPKVLGQTDCVILNIAGETLAEWPQVAARIGNTPGIAALELNVSCPNVEQGGLPFGRDPEILSGIVRAVQSETPLPLICKLPPEAPDLPGLAQAAADAGAVAVSLINTLRALGVDWRRRSARLGYGYGGLSGPAIKPVALRAVHEVSRAVSIPVIGIGGIQSAEDVLEFMVAGATAVQIGTATFQDPTCMIRIIEDLPELLEEEGVSSISDLIGTLTWPPAALRGG